MATVPAVLSTPARTLIRRPLTRLRSHLQVENQQHCKHDSGNCPDSALAPDSLLIGVGLAGIDDPSKGDRANPQDEVDRQSTTEDNPNTCLHEAGLPAARPACR